MKQFPKLLFVFLSVDWPIFSRRPMLEALAEAALEYKTTVVAINRPLCPVSTLIYKPHRLLELFRGPKLSLVAKNLYLYSPKYALHDKIANRWPFVQNLNVRLLNKSLNALQRRIRVQEAHPIVWYYYPQQGYVSKIFGGAFTVFELYDSLTDIYGESNLVSDELELRNRPSVDLMLTTSRRLYETYGCGYGNAYNFGNGLRRSHFENLMNDTHVLDPRLADIPHPRLGYCGAISARLDWKFVCELAQSRPQWNFVFAGQNFGGIPIDRIRGIKNVYLFDTIPIEQLPPLIHSFDVGIMPYLDTPFFHYLNPLKFYEFAAAGIPSVSSPIPELLEFDQRLVRVTKNEPDLWEASIDVQLACNKETVKSLGRTVASQFIWEDMTARLLEYMEKLLVSKSELHGRA